MTLPVVVALVVFFALTVGAFLLGACRASRWAQDERRRHVEELRRAFEAEARGQSPRLFVLDPRPLRLVKKEKP